MKRGFLRLGILALVPASLVVWAAPSLAQGVKFTVSAEFVNVDGCVTTEVFVFARSGEVGGGRSQPNLDLKIFETDDCEDETLLDARANVDLRNNALRFVPGLDTATLNTSVELFDEVSDERFDVRVRVTWTGVDESVTIETKRDVEAPGRSFVRAQPFAKTFRTASASGSISEGGNEFIPRPAEDAAITLSERQ